MSTPTPLFTAASALPAELFGVIDGGCFDDIGAALAAAGLSAMPLYLEGGDPGARDAAGHLVALSEARALRAAIDIAQPRGALVIWSWPTGIMALYRHLRTLNLVEIPNESREHDDDPAYETVLFRHWSPNVLGSLLPQLDPAQRARFLGAATGLAFDATDGAGLMAAPRPAGLPEAPHGYLRFTAGQMARIGEDRVQASDRRIAGYLTDNVPPALLAPHGDDLTGLIHQERATGRALGLETERDLARWTYLQTMTGRRLHEQPAISTLFTGPGMSGTPSDRLDMLFRDITVRMSRMA